MTAEHDIARGERARLILAEPLFIEAFEALERELTDAWANSPARDVDGRETLWLSLKLTKQVRQHLISVMETGKLAEIQLERMSRPGLRSVTG